ncbi:MAG: hypothetical protein ACOCQR_03095 [bacterium]
MKCVYVCEEKRFHLNNLTNEDLAILQVALQEFMKADGNPKEERDILTERADIILDELENFKQIP